MLIAVFNEIYISIPSPPSEKLCVFLSLFVDVYVKLYIIYEHIYIHICSYTYICIHTGANLIFCNDSEGAMHGEEVESANNRA